MMWISVTKATDDNTSLTCVGCGLTNDLEPSVHARADGRVRCNDCEREWQNGGAVNHKSNVKEIHRSHVKSLSEQYAESMVGHLRVGPGVAPCNSVEYTKLENMPTTPRVHPVYSGLAYDGGEFSPTVPRYGEESSSTHYVSKQDSLFHNNGCRSTIIGDATVLTETGAKRLMDEGKRLADAVENKVEGKRLADAVENKVEGKKLKEWDDKTYQETLLSDLITGEDIGKSSNSTTSTSPKGLDSSHKIPVNLCPASAIIAIALVIAQGHKKPGRTIYNWRDKNQKISYMDYHAAALRHLLKSIDGSDFDQELSELAGVPVRHDWAAMSCLAILEDARQAGTLIDDRPVKGGAEEFLDKLTPKKP